MARRAAHAKRSDWQARWQGYNLVVLVSGVTSLDCASPLFDEVSDSLSENLRPLPENGTAFILRSSIRALISEGGGGGCEVKALAASDELLLDPHQGSPALKETKWKSRAPRISLPTTRDAKLDPVAIRATPQTKVKSINRHRQREENRDSGKNVDFSDSTCTTVGAIDNEQVAKAAEEPAKRVYGPQANGDSAKGGPSWATPQTSSPRIIEEACLRGRGLKIVGEIDLTAKREIATYAPLVRLCSMRLTSAAAANDRLSVLSRSETEPVISAQPSERGKTGWLRSLFGLAPKERVARHMTGTGSSPSGKIVERVICMSAQGAKFHKWAKKTRVLGQMAVLDNAAYRLSSALAHRLSGHISAAAKATLRSQIGNSIFASIGRARTTEEETLIFEPALFKGTAALRRIFGKLQREGGGCEHCLIRLSGRQGTSEFLHYETVPVSARGKELSEHKLLLLAIRPREHHTGYKGAVLVRAHRLQDSESDSPEAFKIGWWLERPGWAASFFSEFSKISPPLVAWWPY